MFGLGKGIRIRRNRRLSLPKNWRIVKKTRINGEVFYTCEYNLWLWGWTVLNDYGRDVEYFEIEKIKVRIQDEIIKHVRDYDMECGQMIEKTDIINFK